MIELCESAGLPKIEFEEIGGAFVVIFCKSKLTRKYLAGLGLNARLIIAIEYTRKHGRITNREYVELNHVTRPTATRDLADLVAAGIFQQQGKGRASILTLAK